MLSSEGAIDSAEAWEEWNRELPEILRRLLARESCCAEGPPTEPGRGARRARRVSNDPIIRSETEPLAASHLEVENHRLPEYPQCR
jgi:hypothetical protein